MNSGAGTIHGSVLAAAAERPRGPALAYRSDGRFVSVTYAALVRAVELSAGRLKAFGLRKGDVVGILSPNRPQWIVADLAVLGLGGIVVPVYPSLPMDQLSYIVNDSGMRLLLVGDAELVASICAARDTMPCLEEVVFLDDWGVKFGQPPGGESAQEGDGAGGRAAGFPSEGVGPEDVATIVYTSGTTGEPKGVVLTHGNIVSNARGLIGRYNITSEDVTLSYLPLAHMFERTCGHYVFLFAGGTVAYAEDLSTVARDVVGVRPTVLIAVPRVLEKAYAVARAKIERGAWVRRGVVHRAVSLLNDLANRRYQQKRVPLWLKVRCRMYDALVAARFRKVGGGRLRLIVSGGAPLDRQIGKILRVLGFGLVEGYGLTEASPVVCCGTVEGHRLGTVGKPLEGVEIKLAGGGEILVRGPNIMRGYLNKPRETAAALDGDGWLHTGDLGEIDEDGNLVVTGRIKDIIITSYGKNISPLAVEGRMVRSSYIDKAIVFGDRRKSLVALVVPNRERVERFAAERGITPCSYDSLLGHHAVVTLLENEVEQANAASAPYERVVSFELVSEPFTQENGMLTPTLKLRRGSIADAYADRISSLYKELEEKRAD